MLSASVPAAWRNDMLRITVRKTASEERWILQGQLTSSSVSELVENWKRSCERTSEEKRLVDLSEVTSIDKSGEHALLMMIHNGAMFVATGLYTRHLLANLGARIADMSSEGEHY
jgi:ABC-type transporter Mla MlaB component